MANGDSESRVGAVRQPVDAAQPRLTGRLRPITQRILARLPGPQVLWITVWALVPWLNAGANLLLETEARSAVWEQSRALIVLNYAALSFAVVITLWGTERIERRLETLRVPTLNVPPWRRKRAVS